MSGVNLGQYLRSLELIKITFLGPCTKITSDHKGWRFVQDRTTISSVRPRLLVQGLQGRAIGDFELEVESPKEEIL